MRVLWAEGLAEDKVLVAGRLMSRHTAMAGFQQGESEAGGMCCGGDGGPWWKAAHAKKRTCSGQYSVQQEKC